jgi:hypothetical protein
MERQDKRPDQGAQTQPSAPRKSFSKYKIEKGREIRVQQKTTSPIMKKILELWAAVEYINDDRCDPSYGYDYGEGFADGYNASFFNLIEHMAKKIGHGAEEVERFSILLESHREEPNFRYKAGLFLSALINSGSDEEYLIHVEELGGIDFAGFQNRKKITIDGDVGDCLGDFMAEGEIVVEGNASTCAATRMKGGRIIVKGDVGDNLGFRMDGGEIIVEGDADGLVGANMEDGKITVKGNPGKSNGSDMQGGEIHFECENPPDIVEREYVGDARVVHGKIFHKGKLIVDK